jgi:hypothetical protein
MTPQTLFTGRPPYSSWEDHGQTRLVAYFSMEIAITPAMPTYSGGLGVLAGDTLRAAADMRLPLVAVTLAHRKAMSSSIWIRMACRARQTSRGIWKVS